MKNIYTSNGFKHMQNVRLNLISNQIVKLIKVNLWQTLYGIGILLYEKESIDNNRKDKQIAKLVVGWLC